jgi:hypothetical protein
MAEILCLKASPMGAIHFAAKSLCKHALAIPVAVSHALKMQVFRSMVSLRKGLL